MSVAHCVDAVLPGMLERRAGHIVAISSLAGYRGLPGSAAYSAAKGGLTNFLESLRIDLRGTGVDVTVIAPGFVRTKPGGKKRKPFVMELEPATEHIGERCEPARLLRLSALAGRLDLARTGPAGVDLRPHAGGNERGGVMRKTASPGVSLRCIHIHGALELRRAETRSRSGHGRNRAAPGRRHRELPAAQLRGRTARSRASSPTSRASSPSASVVPSSSRSSPSRI
jgi:hypothetical protein